ncbi:TPA: BCSC C-terminal domain-containing protein [Pseudomonas putida]|nr:BCSC C-terminal domain-containing protein [Pseudomonas putida]
MRKQTLAIAVWAALSGTSATAAEPVSPQVLLVQQGQYWQHKEQADRAAQAWQKLLHIAPEHPDALYGLGLIAVQKDQPAVANGYLQRLRALTPTSLQTLQLQQDISLATPEKQLLLEQARELSDADQREQAVAVYRRLLEGREPQGLIAREYYNTLGFTQDGWPQARKGLEQLARQRPDDSILALFLALHLARNPDSRADGIRALATLSHNPDIGGNADETWRFALEWLGPPKRDQVVLFQQYLQAHPDDTQIRALMNKGLAQNRGGRGGWQRDLRVTQALKALDTGDLASAEAALQARLKEHPRDFDALGGMGVLRQQQKRLDEAEGYLVQATRLPGGAQWRTALADVRYWKLVAEADTAGRAGRFDDARRALDQAIVARPNDPAGPTALAALQARRGQWETAEAQYRQVLARTPDYADALSGLLNVLTQAGKEEQALNLIDGLTAQQRARLPSTLRIKALRATQAGKLAERQGDLSAAQAAYQVALADDPQNPWARFALARVLLERGQVRAARTLMDDHLKRHPDDPDALFGSALLSAQRQAWADVQRTLQRIPPTRRSQAMTSLEQDSQLHLQVEQALELARRGQRQAAWALLAQAEPSAAGKPERVAVVASAYAETGQPEQAERLMQGLQGNPASTRLLKAGVLLKGDQDAEAGEILRALKDQSLDDKTRRQYADLLYRYRVKQADKLRERNDLVAAYDMLAPALEQRPHAPQAVTSLARMYSASGNWAKARQVYQPLLEGDPDNAVLHLGFAELAVEGRAFAQAEQALGQALALQPNEPRTLTQAAQLYRSLGQTSKARQLLNKALDIEQREQPPRIVAVAPSPAARVDNPFVRLPGQRQQATLLASNDWVPAPVADEPGATNRPPAGAYASADTSRVEASPARETLDTLGQVQRPYLNQGLSVRNNNTEKGLGKLTDIQTPLEIGFPLDEAGRSMALRVTPTWLQAGTPKGYSVAQFGTSGLASVGRQEDSGVGLAVAYRDEDRGLKGDLGVSPLGFTYSTAVGGISLERALQNAPDYRYTLSASRRSVTDSVTSFAGSRDPRSGVEWGGVTANGVRAELSHDDQRTGAYGYASAHRLLGEHVEANNRFELGSGIYWYLHNTRDSRLTLGVNGTAMSYSDNQNFYTYGHGGYFSPQKFFALGIPVDWAQRGARLSYALHGSVGVQYIDQDSAPIFPGHSALQRNADAVGLSRYAGQSKTGIGYSFSATGEYRLDRNLYLGANLGLDNANDYKQYAGSLYLRYGFDEVSRPMPLPVRPFTSPYTH